MVGTAVGMTEGKNDGINDGLLDGDKEGLSVGETVGSRVIHASFGDNDGGSVSGNIDVIDVLPELSI